MSCPDKAYPFHLTLNDAEDHLIALCGILAIGDPFAATERFIKTFADDDETLQACVQHIHEMRLGMEDDYYA